VQNSLLQSRANKHLLKSYNFKAVEICTHLGSNISNSYVSNFKKLLPAWVQISTAALDF